MGNSGFACREIAGGYVLVTVKDAQDAHRSLGRPKVDAASAIGQCLQAQQNLVSRSTRKTAQRNPFDLLDKITNKA
jgi:hypothetical protein